MLSTITQFLGFEATLS